MKDAMEHELMTICGLVITYGDMREEDYADVIPYRVTREGDALGTDFVEGRLPECTPLKSRGFSEEELQDIEQIMRDNMMIVYDQTRKVGAWA